MKFKNIKYWFQTLPFLYAFRLTVLYFTKRIFFNQAGVFFSQTGEDIILSNIMQSESGFFIDVGCHHPIRLSNTFLFYLNGWRGINIDANELLIKDFKKIRMNDIAVTAAISDKEENVSFLLSSQEATSKITEKPTAGDNIINLQSASLNSVLERFNVKGKIDFLSIDVEGHELNVLHSIDLKVYDIDIICVEIHGLNLLYPLKNDVIRFLLDNNYDLIGYCLMNAYFKKGIGTNRAYTS